LQITIASGAESISLGLTPGLFLRPAQVSGAFEFFRFTKCSYALVPGFKSSTAICAAIGYIPDETTNAGTALNLQQVSELSSSQTLGYYEATRRWTEIPRSVLLGNTPTRWWKTDAASGEDVEVLQGTFFVSDGVSPAATRTFPVEVRYVMEFAGAETISFEPRPLPRLGLMEQKSSIDDREDVDSSDAVIIPPLLLRQTGFDADSVQHPTGRSVVGRTTGRSVK